MRELAAGPARGAIVHVTMTRNDIFPWQSGPTFPARFVEGPRGAGDTFVFDVGGRHVQINGNSSDFVGIVFVAPTRTSGEQEEGELEHPTYGTLDDLLAVIAADTRRGHELRMGLLGALSWFAGEYSARRARSRTTGGLG